MHRAALFLFVVGCTRTPIDDPYRGQAYPPPPDDRALPASFALVPSSGSDRLTVIDLATSRAVTSVPIGRKPVLLDGPQQVAVDLAKKTAYVLDAYPEALETAGNHSHGASKRDGWVQGLSLGGLFQVSEVRVDPNPGELALSADGKRLVVTHFDLAAITKPDLAIEARRSSLAVIDPAEMKSFGTPEPDKLLVCAAPHGLALSRPRGDEAYVACYGEDAIAFVDLEHPHEPVVRVPMGIAPNETGQPRYGPYGVALSPDGKWLAASMRLSRDLILVDVTTRRRTATVYQTFGEPYVAAWSTDGKKLFVPTRGTDAVAVVDPTTAAILNERIFDQATCIAPMEAIAGEDVVHVLCEGNARTPGALLTLDAQTLETKGRVEVGILPGRPFVGHR